MNAYSGEAAKAYEEDEHRETVAAYSTESTNIQHMRHPTAKRRADRHQKAVRILQKLDSGHQETEDREQT
jgi:hypothetical protein